MEIEKKIKTLCTILIVIIVITFLRGIQVNHFDKKAAACAPMSSSVSIIGKKTMTTRFETATIRVAPHENVTMAPVTNVKIAWEKAINGIPVRRYPVHGEPIDLVADVEALGPVRTVAGRICEGQGINSKELAFVKHTTPSPPPGWFEEGLKK